VENYHISLYTVLTLAQPIMHIIYSMAFDQLFSELFIISQCLCIQDFMTVGQSAEFSPTPQIFLLVCA